MLTYLNNLVKIIRRFGKVFELIFFIVKNGYIFLLFHFFKANTIMLK